MFGTTSIRSRIRAVVVLAFASVLALAAISAAKPGASAGDAAKKARIARGLYLTTVIGCNDCHTPGGLYGAADFNRKLSGSELGWHGPWGVSFPSNLTPDMDTGLGYWSEAEIVKAIRTGVKNDGKMLLPPMPWQDFSGLSDADVHAIAAYLMSLPAVSHKVPDAVPPGQAFTGTVIELPPPPAWDVPPPADHK